MLRATLFLLLYELLLPLLELSCVITHSPVPLNAMLCSFPKLLTGYMCLCADFPCFLLNDFPSTVVTGRLFIWLFGVCVDACSCAFYCSSILLLPIRIWGWICYTRVCVCVGNLYAPLPTEFVHSFFVSLRYTFGILSYVVLCRIER